MATRKPFLLRLDPATFAAIQRWADDELRSVNGQMEFVLRRALQDAGRMADRSPPGAGSQAGHPAPGQQLAEHADD